MKTFRTTPERLDADMRRVLSKALGRLAVEIKQGLAAEALVILPPESPVLTGRFRGSWAAGAGQPPDANAGDRGFFGVPGRAQAEAALSNLTEDQSAFVSNAARESGESSSYAESLWKGRSSQNTDLARTLERHLRSVFAKAFRKASRAAERA